jgi:hypothetical protein
MSGTNIDHMVSIIVFLSAILIFIGLFSQTIETAVLYQQHSTLAVKAGDLLDTILLNPGIPSNWSLTDWNQQGKVPTNLGLQDPAFMQYQLGPFSLMRLSSTSGGVINYHGQTFNNLTMSSGTSLLVPSTQTINSSLSSKLMGINGTYGFSLTISPTIDVSITEVKHDPLNISISARGQGFVLANASLTYCLITATGSTPPAYPSIALNYGTNSTDVLGSANLYFSSLNVTQKSYAIVVYVSLSGMSGVGYFEKDNSSNPAGSIIPIISSFENRTIILEHSYDLNSQGYNGNLTYTATFLRATDMIQTSLNKGKVSTSGILYFNPSPSHVFDAITIDPNTLGVLVVAYSRGANDSGIVVTPWGLSSLGFSITLGGQYTNRNWVSTDIRQVLINGIPYQAKLALWNVVTGVNGE